MKIGMNVFPMMMRPTRNASGGYSGTAFPYADKMTAAIIKNMVSLGIDTIRLMVDPGPMLGGQGWSPTMNLMTAKIDLFLANGIGSVVVVPTPVSDDPNWSWNVMFAPANQAIKVNGSNGYRAVLVNGFAATLKSKGYGSNVILSVGNEPQCWSADVGTEADFATMQAYVINHVLALDPNRPIMATFPHSQWIDGMRFIDPSAWASNANVLYDFHWYAPRLDTIFSDQGYADDPNRPFLKYMKAANNTQLRWPEQPARVEPFLARLKAAMSIDGLTLSAKWETALRAYFTTQSGYALVMSEFAQVKAWCDKYGIPYGRMTLSEFGCYRKVDGSAGALTRDVMQYNADIAAAADACGFPRFSFNFWPGDTSDGWTVLNSDGTVQADIVRDGLGLAA